MKVRSDDWIRIFVLALITAPAVAFMTFDFVFPNISTPSLQKNLLVAFLLSILFGMPSGYMTKRTDIAVVTILVYVLVGYILAVVAYSAPFLFYDFDVIFPGQYVMFFLNMTVILVMLFFLGGVIGVIMGQILRESYESDETEQVFSKVGP